jgi:hypothetical protein
LDEDGDSELADQGARVFVATADEWTSSLVENWMKYFGISNVNDIYYSYLDKSFLAKLSFDDRRRFLSLLSQYIVPVRKRLIHEVCGDVDPESAGILRAQDDDSYHLDTGFGHLLLREDLDDYDRRLDAAMSRSHDPGQFL